MSDKIGQLIEDPGEPVTIDSAGRIASIESNSVRSDTGEGQARPDGSGPEIIAGYETVGPDTIGVIPTERKRRGRPRGSRNTQSIGAEKTQTSGSLIDLTTILLSIHSVGAALLNIQELELDKSEATSMSDAIKEVLKYYPVGMDPKKLAIANLVIVSGGIYATRMMAYRARMAEEEKTKPKITPIDRQKQATVNANGMPLNPSDIWPSETLNEPVFNL